MPKQCSHPDCTYNVFSKNLCQTHWRYLYSTKVAPTSQNKPVYRTKEIKKVSTRQQKLNAAYAVLATQFKKNHPVCQARIKCIGSPTTDVHHKRGKGQYFLDERTFLATCRLCHTWIHDHDSQAKALGLSESRLDKHNE